MTDLRIAKLAQVLINYSLAIRPGEELVLHASPLADELNLAVYKEAVLAGANVLVMPTLPGASELFMKYASDDQLAYVSPVHQLITERFVASLTIGASHNTRELAAIDPSRLSQRQRATAELTKLFYERAARNDLRWCYTVFPTNASAQDANMSLPDYEDFVFGAGMLDRDDPVAAWQEEGKRQFELIRWLADKDVVEIKGNDIDLKLSVKGRPFIEANGKYNFPDGEIFTAPVEQSVNGWVRFSYPLIHRGREVTGATLWFEDGKVVKESATSGEDLLTAQLNTDQGARYLGEWGIGTNYDIQRFTKNMLFDEKIGGTIHFAVGNGYPESGSKNNSGIHWDMLCNMSDGEIVIDGELFYKDGRFVV
jgi:aminopeptidase